MYFMAMKDSEIFARDWCKNSTKLRELSITQQKIYLSLLFNINTVWGNKACFFSPYPLQFSGFKNIEVAVINVTNKNVKECLLSRKKNDLFFVLNMIWHIFPWRYVLRMQQIGAHTGTAHYLAGHWVISVFSEWYL